MFDLSVVIRAHNPDPRAESLLADLDSLGYG